MFLTEIRGLGTAKYVVSIDMDGVLADFDARVREVFGKSVAEIPTRDLWVGISRHDKNVEPFFENLPMMRDAQELIDFVDKNFYKWNILTASGYTPKNVEEQKRKWVAKVISPKVDVLVVRKSPEKARFAAEDAILIDDRMKSIDPWRAAGGIGIFHTSAAQSIKELQEFIKRD